MPDDVVYDGVLILYKLTPFPGLNKSESCVLEEPVPDPTGRYNLILQYQIKLVQKTSTGDLARYVANTRASSIYMPQVFRRLLITRSLSRKVCE